MSRVSHMHHQRSLPDAPAWQRIRHDFLRRERLLLALPVLALWPITASGFTYLKSVIPLVQPFYLDPVLAEWDRTLHFGIDPWRYLQPLETAGLVFAIFTITVAAAEVAVGLAMVIAVYRAWLTINADEVDTLQG